MDARTPPIPLKLPEKSQLKKAERVSDLSLPPLTSCPIHRATNKLFDTSWSQKPPCVTQHQDHRTKRSYRVLDIGATPLMHACQQGDKARVFKLLKEQRDTINYRDRTLRNTLHYCMDAATGGAIAAVAPELVNAPDVEGHTPLHLAVIAGDTQLVAVLLANGADVNAKDLEGHSVLHWATVCGEAECVRLVLTAGARPSSPDLRGGSPLHYAAQCCGTVAMVELAVPKKVGLQVLEMLLEFGANVNAKDEDGRQPILWAASAGSVEAVLALARVGGVAAAGTSDKDGLTALHCAASRGHVKCMEALINLCGSQPDHVDDNGCSALHYASTLGHADATALILKLGADPNRQDRKGRTPALCAAAKGQLETLKILIQHGGSFHLRTVRGTGIGHEAVASGRIELIKWLTKKKPSLLDVATHDGKTPFHVAALHGYLDVCKILLDHGARINATFKTSKGVSMTALDAALYREHRDCAKLIQMHGGVTAQQLRTRKTTPNRAKFRVKYNESNTASDSSPYRGHGDSEFCNEERRSEKRTRRKGNPKKHTRRNSRSFSEEIRLLKKKDERRVRSESARYDNSGSNERNLYGKQNERKSMKHSYEYLGSSATESDSCGYSTDEEKTIVYQNVKNPRGKDKIKNSNRTETKKDSRSENDDDQSVSDDSLEVIVVKKSLKKKYEKIVSGKILKAPKEYRKKTKLKVQKCNSRKTSTFNKSKALDIDENSINQDESLRNKGKENLKVEESKVHTLQIPSSKEEDENTEGIMEFQNERNVTDSTSQETVERVIVTAMVHKDQMPETPNLTLETMRKVSSDDVLRKETAEAEETKETVDKSKIEPLGKTEAHTVIREKLQQVTQENSGISEKIEDKGRLDTIADATLNNNMPRVKEKMETIEDKICDKSADLNIDKNNEELRSDASDVVSNLKNVEKQINYKQRDETRSKQTKTASAGEQFKSSKDTQSENEEKDSDKIDDNKILKKLQGDKGQKSKALILNERSNDGKHSNDSERSRKLIDFLSTELPSKVAASNAGKTSAVLRKELSHDKKSDVEIEKSDREPREVRIGGKEFRRTDDSCPRSPKSSSSKSAKARRSKLPTKKSTKPENFPSKTPTRKHLFGSTEECFPDRSAIIAVIDSSNWNENMIEKEINKVLGEDDTEEYDTELEKDNEISVARVLSSSSRDRILSEINSLPRVHSTIDNDLPMVKSDGYRERRVRKELEDSGGRDSGIEPSPRVSRIPRRKNMRCCPNTAKQQTLNIETITRDVHINLRRYYLERKIFFQLMELKRLQIRHSKANEHVLVKRQVDAFHKSGMTGPVLGVARYDGSFTFRQFEAFLYEQLRRLQGRPIDSNFCIEAKQCTRRTHHCHHATSAYTSIPIYTYLNGDVSNQVDRLPKIENRSRGQMTVKVMHGEEKQVIALPTDKLDPIKRYFVTFTVKGEIQDIEKPRSSHTVQRNTKSV